MVKLWIARGILGSFLLAAAIMFLIVIWHGPEPWKVLGVIVGVLGLIIAFLWSICVIQDHYLMGD